MRSRSIVLLFVLACALIASSCNTRWDTPYAINFPETFQGNWKAVNGDSVQITHNRFTISSGRSPITNESEYRSRFDWIDIEYTDDLVTIVPTNVSGSVGRIDTFTINTDGTLSIEFGGEEPRSFGPFSRQTQTS